MDNGEAYQIAWRSTWEAAESLVHALREMVPADYGIELALERPRSIDVYPMDRAWLSGRTSAEHLRHTRPAYYAKLKKAEAAQAAQPLASAEAPESESPSSLDVPTAIHRES